jgi:hypothetical protein
MKKTSLSDSLIDEKETCSKFTGEELRDLFRLDEETDCLTLQGLRDKSEKSSDSVSLIVSPFDQSATLDPPPSFRF